MLWPPSELHHRLGLAPVGWRRTKLASPGGSVLTESRTTDCTRCNAGLPAHSSSMAPPRTLKPPRVVVVVGLAGTAESAGAVEAMDLDLGGWSCTENVIFRMRAGTRLTLLL
jgi:hypothetical protein